MAHFAELDSNNTVLRVVVVHDNECMADGVESEAAGAAFCQRTFGGTWLKTSFNGTIRKRFASAGYTYDAVLDVFIPPKSFASWVFDEVDCLWVAPTPMPTDDKPYLWDEATVAWKEVEVAE